MEIERKSFEDYNNQLCDELKSHLNKKSKKYGYSFHKGLDTSGLQYGMKIIEEKINQINEILPQAISDAIPLQLDKNFKDIASYCLLFRNYLHFSDNVKIDLDYNALLKTIINCWLNFGGIDKEFEELSVTFDTEGYTLFFDNFPLFSIRNGFLMINWQWQANVELPESLLSLLYALKNKNSKNVIDAVNFLIRGVYKSSVEKGV